MGASGIMSELESSNISKDRKKLVLMKLWRTDPENQDMRWSTEHPGDSSAILSEDGDSGSGDNREDGASGQSTPVISGATEPVAVGQQTGQTGQTGPTGFPGQQRPRRGDQSSPEASPRVTAMELEPLGLVGEVDDEDIEVEEEDPWIAYEGGCPGDAETKYHIYEFMENPETPTAHAFSGFVMFVIVFSVGTMIAESLPKYAWNEVGDKNTEAEDAFFILETVCIMIFTLEFGVRFYCCADKCTMMSQGMNIVDVLAISPYYLTLILSSIVDTSDLKILRLLRLIRVFRVLKLAKYNRSLAVAIQALSDSTDMFGLMIFMLIVLCILFAAFEYNFEFDAVGSPTTFSSIPQAMWWCHVTVMMVGYGDMYPVTIPGKIIAAGCIVVGILIMALPISVIGSNFSRTWAQYEAKVREEQKALEKSIVLSPSEKLKQETERLEDVKAKNKEAAKLLEDFEKCCDGQVKRIKETETEVFNLSQDVWEKFAVDAKRLTPAVELWRERAVRTKVKDEENFMKSLAEDNGVLSKVLDAELDEQLCRALVNAQWMRLLARKYAIVVSDMQRMAAHLGKEHKVEFPEVAQSLQTSREAWVGAGREAGVREGGPQNRASTPQDTSRGRTPSPPPMTSTSVDSRLC